MRTSRKARTQMRRRGKATAQLAEDLGVTVDQLRRVLRGEAHLLFADSYLIAEHLRRDDDKWEQASG